METTALKWIRGPVAAVLVVSSGCGDVIGIETTTPLVPIQVLRAAPTTVSVGSYVLIAEAFLWRDFMPGQDDTRLRAVGTVATEERTPIAEEAAVARLWVLGDWTVWETKELEEPSPHEVGEVAFRAEGGPRWDTGTVVDVVLYVVGVAPDPVLLRVAGVEISRTW